MSDQRNFLFLYSEDYSYAMRRFLADKTPSYMTKCFLKENFVEGEDEDQKMKTTQKIDCVRTSKKQKVVSTSKSFLVLDCGDSDSDS